MIKKIIGITGTRKGMTDCQVNSFLELLDNISSEVAFMHGDCNGADKNAHNLIVNYGFKDIRKRPCYFSNQRAFTKEGAIIAAPEHPLDRNKKIVNDSHTIIAFPGKAYEELRSGTWSTIRYAKKQNKNIQIIWPDGRIQMEY